MILGSPSVRSMFYDRLGEDVANELVDWFNQVDATYRADLRELNELNFARFDAKLEQRITELRLEIGRLEERMESRFQTMESRFQTMEERLKGALAIQKAGMVRWMLGFWLATVIPVLGLVATLLR